MRAKDRHDNTEARNKEKLKNNRACSVKSMPHEMFTPLNAEPCLTRAKPISSGWKPFNRGG